MTRSKAPKAPEAGADPLPDFEAAMAELEGIVERLEQGDLALEASLAQFERGVALTRRCQAALAAAEQRVQVLLQKPGAEPALEDFDAAGDEA